MGSLSSSARVQYVFCRSCSTRRCSFDVFVHALFLRHLEGLPIISSNKFLCCSLSSHEISVRQMLLHLMLSHRSLKLYSLFKFFFFLLLCFGEFHYPVFQNIDSFFVSSSLLLKLSSVFFSLVIVFFRSLTSVWQFCTFSVSLLKFLLCSFVLFLSLISIFMTITLNSL